MKRLPLLLILLPFAFLAFNQPGAGPQTGTCLDCHSDKTDKQVVHEAAKEGCDFCHTSSGKEHPGDEKGFALVSANICLDCHYFETEGAISEHGPFQDGACLDCHDPHQSDYTYLMKMETGKLCLSCHNKETKVGNFNIRSIAEDLAEGNDIHEAVDGGECATCHVGHTSVNHFLLLGKYPASQYTQANEENFEICFMCHDAALLTADETDYATNFRNATRNLHKLHIRDSRGRNCNLCHNVHGAPHEHLIENSVQYGKWDMPLQYEMTENGGSCATGCHKRKEYSRLTN